MTLNEKIINIIASSTLSEHNRTKEDNENVRYVKETKNGRYLLKVKTKDNKPYEFAYSKFSDKIDDEETIKDLESNSRYKKCHRESIILCEGIEESKLITGFVNTTDSPLIHTIVVLGNQVIDYTLNLVMNYNKYAQLRNFKPIAMIDSETIRRDLEDPQYREVIGENELAYIINRSNEIKRRTSSTKK